MKVAFAAVAALLFAQSAFAQPAAAPAGPPALPQPPPLQSACPALPAQVPMPDGAAADMATMAAFEAYMQSLSQVLNCRRVEIDALKAQVEPRITAFNASVTAWPAEVAEFNARQPPARRR